ncbi:MAG: Ion transport 2 domain protein, partial [Myxococcaceae bacterium]|nr:Ion transport 2 domain protein [Myxococcaceae bacterium]
MSDAPPPVNPRRRAPEHEVGDRVVRIGMPRTPFADFYASLLASSWSLLVGVITGAYVVLNLFFASLFYFGGATILNAREGSFQDAFFFSVQTFATIGYGAMSPQGFFGNLLVTIEAIVGILFVAMATGLMFAKFSRPSARVVFSRNAVITKREGVPTLMFRMANERGNRIVEASVRVVLVRNETTSEGEKVRRFYDLPLTRAQTALFAFTWSAMSPITETSPLYGETTASLEDSEDELVISLVGIDETLSQTIHARHYYGADDVLFGRKFVDILASL